MASNLRLLDADKSTVFSSHNFNRVLAGTISGKKLIFVNSYGDEDALDTEFGLYAVSGNDGVNYGQISLGEGFSANGTTLSVTVNASGGGIPDTASLRYKISAVDENGHESEANSNVVIPTLNTGNTNQVVLSWTTISGAVLYKIYISVDGGTTYGLIGSTANLTFTDNAGVAGTSTPPATGSVAYRPTVWGTAPITFGTLAIGAKIPVFVRENVPLGITAQGNQRHHRTYLAFS